MENLSSEWLHDFMCIILFLIYLLIGAHEVSNRSLLRFFMWIILIHRIKYTRQMPSLIQVFWYGIIIYFFVYQLNPGTIQYHIILFDSSVILDSGFHNPNYYSWVWSPSLPWPDIKDCNKTYLHIVWCTGYN